MSNSIQNNNKCDLNQSQLEEIAKKAIDIVNANRFANNNNQKYGVTSNSLRTLLKKLMEPQITPGTFRLFLFYQVGRNSSARGGEHLKKFIDMFIKAYKEFFDKWIPKNCSPTDQDKLKIKIIKELLVDIIMAATYKKEFPKEQLKIN